MHTANMYRNHVPVRRRVARSASTALAICGVVVLSVGCGGSKGASGGATTAGGGVGMGGASGEVREISKDARADYRSAVEYFEQREKEGWNRDSCKTAADKFADVASTHPELIEASYMSALSYDRCGMSEQAESAYERVLAKNGSHALSMSNLGTLAFKAGDVAKAKQRWEQAVEIDGKITAARNNLAWLLLQEMRKTGDRSTWNKLESAAGKHLSSSLAVNSEIVETYVLYGLLYLEGSERNRNRLDLANLLLDEGAKRNDAYPPLYNARGLLQMKRSNLGEALANFQKAVALDGGFVEARLNVGNITLGFRKYDEAEAQFTEVLKHQPNNYDAQVGLGIAQRGLGKLGEAEATYKKAIEIDANRGDTYFNLGVLYKDFFANRASELKDSKKAYETARDYFRTFLSKEGGTKESTQEAKDNISDCDKIIKQLDEIIKATAQQG